MSVSDRLSQVLIDEVNRPGAITVQADIADVDFIDSTVINAFIDAFRVAKSHGHAFVVTRARGHVNTVLAVSGVLSALSNPPVPAR